MGPLEPGGEGELGTVSPRQSAPSRAATGPRNIRPWLLPPYQPSSFRKHAEPEMKDSEPLSGSWAVHSEAEERQAHHPQ